jgi:hypothetical protein
LFCFSIEAENHSAGFSKRYDESEWVYDQDYSDEQQTTTNSILVTMRTGRFHIDRPHYSSSYALFIYIKETLSTARTTTNLPSTSQGKINFFSFNENICFMKDAYLSCTKHAVENMKILDLMIDVHQILYVMLVMNIIQT